MKRKKEVFAFILSFCMLLQIPSLKTYAADSSGIYPGTYSVSVRLVNAVTDEDSMGNASMIQTGTIRVSDQGETTLELDFQSMIFAGLTGYLYKLKKVDMSSVQYNQYQYPAQYTAADAQILEEYTGIYDLFNDSASEYYDEKTQGGWYPKKLSIPIQPNDNMFYVEVYVPVMESIGEGQGTKVARLSIDWEHIIQLTGVNRDNSALDALLDRVSKMTGDGIPENSWKALQEAYVAAQNARKDMNTTQAEIDRQTAALQAAVDATQTGNGTGTGTGSGTGTGTEKPVVDKTALTALIQTAQAESSRTDVYTAETLDKLKLAIANAQAVAGKETATQEEVQAQITALDAAIQALEKRPETPAADKKALERAIAQAKELSAQADVYTPDSLTALKRAIAAAQEVYDNANALQSDVDAQAAALNAAVTALEKQTPKETPAAPEVTEPAAPAGVKAVSAAYDKITITWSAVEEATSYEIYQYNSSTKEYDSIASITGISYTQKNLKTGGTYTYKVRAYRTADGEKIYSPDSKTVSAKPALSKAAGVKAKNAKRKTATVSWKKVSGASGYEVYRSTKKTAGFKKVTTIKKNSTVKYADGKLKKGKTYYYKVRAYRTVDGRKVYAAYSSAAKVKIGK